VTDQLDLGLEIPREPAKPSANAHLFDENGRMRRLLWCSDDARLGGSCPYVGEKARFMPEGGCCKDLVLDGPNPLTARAAES
jgi:hypothetical protein